LLYAYELHCHTNETSRCGEVSGVEQARAYKEAGYTGLCITDHFFNGNSGIPRDLPWEERIDLHYRGYEAAKAEGDRIGLQVFFGIEVKPLSLAAEFLAFKLPREWWKAHPDMLEWDHETFARKAHEAGGFLIHCHPYRQAPYLPPTIYLYPDCVDAVEVINCRQKGDQALYNRQAYEYAKEYDKPMTCGGDNHGSPKLDYPMGGIWSPRVLKDEADLCDLIQSRQHYLKGTQYLFDDGQWI